MTSGEILRIDAGPDQPPSGDLWEHRVRAWALLVSVAGLILGALWIRGYTLDDAFIGFQYARNLAEGRGLVLNPGERVEGYTNFLWVILLAAVPNLTAHAVLASKILGLLFNALTLVVCYLLCGIIRTEQAPAYGGALLLIASNAAFLASAVDGLETPLFTLLMCCAVVSYLKGLRAAHPKAQAMWLAASSLLFGLLVMTRPDGALTFGLIWVHAAWRFRARPGKLGVFSIPFLVVYAPYFLWRWQYYGLLLPNTFYAKQGGSLMLYARGAARIRNFLGLQAGGLLVAGAVALSVVLFGTVESTVLGLAVLSRLLFELWSGGEWSGYFRFLVPALPFIWILTERFCIGWVRRAQLGKRGSYALAGLLALMLVNQAAHFASLRSRLFEPHRLGFERAHIALGKWLKQNSSPHATLAIGAIGAVPFYSELRVIDLVGLADAHVARLPGALYKKVDPSYVLSRFPEYIVLLPRDCEPRGTDFWSAMEKGIYESSQFQARYQRAGCWDFIEGYNLVLYRRNADAPLH